MQIPYMRPEEKAIYFASFQVYKEDNDKAMKDAKSKGKRGRK